jgi:hypothetical protein
LELEKSNRHIANQFGLGAFENCRRFRRIVIAFVMGDGRSGPHQHHRRQGAETLLFALHTLSLFFLCWSALSSVVLYGWIGELGLGATGFSASKKISRIE